MLSRGEEKRIRGLSRRRQREREGSFVAEGVRVAEELLAAGVVLETALISSSLGDTERGRRLVARLDALAAAGEVRLFEVTDAELRDLGDTTTPQGVLVVASTPSADLASVQPRGAGVVLVLDGVQDPGNLGTLARSAAAFACDAVVCLPGTVDPWNGKSVRASAGTLFRLPVVQATAAALREWLDAHGFMMVAAETGGDPVIGGALPERVALVLGNEGAGLSEEVAARCDRSVSIPMKGGAESLNVAVAGGILLYELTRERG